MSRPQVQDVDRGPIVMGVFWAETAVAIIVVAMRFSARLIIRNLGWDDWLMFITLALFITCVALTTVQNSVGGYRHSQFLPEDAVMYALEMNFILRGVDIIAYATGKAAIGALILRVTGPLNLWQRWVVWVVIVFTAIVNVLNCIFNFVQCNPVQGNWDPKAPHNCWPARAQLDFAYFMSSENIVADVILAVIPATFLSNLKMSRRRRRHLSFLLGLGSMAAVCGIIKTTELNSISGDDHDFTWGEYSLTLWGVSEIFVIIVCGCVPTLKPLWDRFGFDRTKGAIRDNSDTASDHCLNWSTTETRHSQQYPIKLSSFSAKPKYGEPEHDDINGLQ